MIIKFKIDMKQNAILYKFMFFLVKYNYYRL